MGIKIGSTGSAKGIGGVRGTTSSSSVSGTDFASYLETPAEVSQNAPVTGLNGVSAVEAMLLAQSVGDQVVNEERKRRAVKHGENLLDRLEDIRLALLQGSISKSKLIELAQLLRVRREEGLDDKLSALLDEIELRAEVELAKLTYDV